MVIGIVVAFLAYCLYPLHLSVKFLLTGKVMAQGCENPTTPTLRLRKVRSCNEVDPTKEPCVIRNAVSQEQLDAFMAESGDNGFVVKEINTGVVIGNPLLEPNALDTENRRYCTLNEIAAENEKCLDMYAGFRSLNYSNYVALNSSSLDLARFSRTDIFLGYMSKTQVTASFHSNNFERSSTLQVVGKKDWLLMSPQAYMDHIQAYSLGAYNAAHNVCVNALDKMELQTVRTGPGDVMNFPKAWPHHIYSIAGPNIMINFRSVEMNLIPRDILSVASTIAAGKSGGFLNTAFCDPSITHPTSYGMGNPLPHWTHAAHRKYDMRCTDLFNKNIYRYKEEARARSVQKPEIDQAIYDQVNLFHSRTE